MNIVGRDIELYRKLYDDALEMRGVPAIYQFPHLATSNTQGEAVVDSYSDEIKTHIFFDGAPKMKTYKRLGWVVENDKDLPFLIHCSFHLPSLQKDSIFRIAGQYTGMPERTFRVTELTCSIEAPDHMIAQVVPVYEKNEKGIAIEKKTEIDFVINRGMKRYYIQSALSMDDMDKARQELRPLLGVKDMFRKVVITKTTAKPWFDDMGVLRIGIYDFLLDEKSLDF